MRIIHHRDGDPRNNDLDNLEEREMRRCAHCGDAYVPVSEWQAFCSAACQHCVVEEPEPPLWATEEEE